MSEEQGYTGPPAGAPLHQRLLYIQTQVKYLEKNNQSKQYSYVSSSQTLAAIRGHMDAQQLLLVPAITAAKVHPGVVYKGKMHLTELHMTFTWECADNPDDKMECAWYGQGVDDGEKGVGKALTYAEKYFLWKFFHIAMDKDDPDYAGNQPQAQQPSGGQSPAASSPAGEFGPCPKCGAELRLRENSKGSFVGCSSYRGKDNPGCGFTCNVEDASRAGVAPEAGPPAPDENGFPTTGAALHQWMSKELMIAPEELRQMRARGAVRAWGGPPEDWKLLTEVQMGELARAIKAEAEEEDPFGDQ